MSLLDKNKDFRVVITGAGSGIGRAISLLISEKNPTFKLILVGRNKEKLNETLRMLKDATQHEIALVDLKNQNSIQNFKYEIEKKNLEINSLILNAGIGGENEYGEHDRWNEIISTNLTGPYQLTQELIPLMKNRSNHSSNEYKNIIFISSILARLGIPKYSAYCASKAGLLGLMRSLAAEHANDKILVNAICPGWVETEMAKEGINQLAQAIGKSAEIVLKEQMSMVPLRKMSAPKEIAELVNFLISGHQTSITGQTLDINNGALMV